LVWFYLKGNNSQKKGEKGTSKNNFKILFFALNCVTIPNVCPDVGFSVNHASKKTKTQVCGHSKKRKKPTIVPKLSQHETKT
jgi:hypothetical protein